MDLVMSDGLSSTTSMATNDGKYYGGGNYVNPGLPGMKSPEPTSAALGLHIYIV